jgi:hypothetical protein
MLKFHVSAHTTIQSRQEQFSNNIWAGIAGDCFLGPYFLPHRLKVIAYRRFRTLCQTGYRSDGYSTRNLWYVHDGALAPFIHVPSFRLPALGDRYEGGDQYPRKLVYRA